MYTYSIYDESHAIHRRRTGRARPSVRPSGRPIVRPSDRPSRHIDALDRRGRWRRSPRCVSSRPRLGACARDAMRVRWACDARDARVSSSVIDRRARVDARASSPRSRSRSRSIVSRGVASRGSADGWMDGSGRGATSDERGEARRWVVFERATDDDFARETHRRPSSDEGADG